MKNTLLLAALFASASSYALLAQTTDPQLQFIDEGRAVTSANPLRINATVAGDQGVAVMIKGAEGFVQSLSEPASSFTVTYAPLFNVADFDYKDKDGNQKSYYTGKEPQTKNIKISDDGNALELMVNAPMGGQYTIKVDYAGNADYSPANIQTTLDVVPTATSLGLGILNHPFAENEGTLTISEQIQPWTDQATEFGSLERAQITLADDMPSTNLKVYYKVTGSAVTPTPADSPARRAASTEGYSVYGPQGLDISKNHEFSFILSQNGVMSDEYPVVLQDVSTAVDEIADAPAGYVIYNLNGQKVNAAYDALDPGIYIVNGKKLLVK